MWSGRLKRSEPIAFAVASRIDWMGLRPRKDDERKAARKAFFPSSIGLSFLVPEACRTLAVMVRWGDYELAEIDTEGGRKVTVWQRTPREEPQSVPLTGAAGPVPHEVADSGGLELSVVERPIVAGELTGALLPAGTRAVSCFLVNRRAPDGEQPDRAYAFQAEVEVGPTLVSCRAPTCAARALRTGTSRWLTCTTPTRRSTPPATALRPSGRW